MTQTTRTRLRAVAAGLLAGAGALLGAGPAHAAATVDRGTLDAYIAGVARAWEPLVTVEGRVVDPLDPADSGDNYGVIMLADVMLKAAARDRDTSLSAAGERIVQKAATLPVAKDPFNLLAIASLLADGRAGRFPAAAWSRLAPSVTALAARIRPPVPPGCLTTPGCYTNWRLVRSAGLGELIAAGQPGGAAEEARTVATIRGELATAVAHVSPPAKPTVLNGARELSDPGPEPPSYHVFSSALLGIAADTAPAAITPAAVKLRAQITAYAMQLMAPDGQLSFAGRSLDQSWVQAAGAALGAREAADNPAAAAQWRAFADRAFFYLRSTYPPRSDGLVPIVPGLLVHWSPDIVDSYAAFDQYEGLTLWFLSDALEHWPDPSAPRAPLPADAPRMLVGDLASSGLAWGRSGPVWWALSARTTAADRRSEQGLLAIKVFDAGTWHDLLALRPLHSRLSTAWSIALAGGRRASWRVTAVRGSGRRAEFIATYRLPHPHAVTRWTLQTTSAGAVVSVAIPRRGRLSTTVWPTTAAALSGRGRSSRAGRCTVTAAAPSCPARFSWADGARGTIAIEVR